MSCGWPIGRPTPPSNRRRGARPRPARSSRRYNLAHGGFDPAAPSVERGRMEMDEQGMQGEQTAPAATWLDLYDWRQRVARLYAERSAALMAGDDPRAVLQRFRAGKDTLLARHPQSPLDPPGPAAFTRLNYFPYDAAPPV